MKELLNVLNNKRVTIDLTVEEVAELKQLLEKDTLIDGIPTDNGCKCPRCGDALIKDKYHCPLCGQRAKYIESDIIPL